MFLDIMGIVVVIFLVGVICMELFEGNHFFHS